MLLLLTQLIFPVRKQKKKKEWVTLPPPPLPPTPAACSQPEFPGMKTAAFLPTPSPLECGQLELRPLSSTLIPIRLP